MECLYSYEAVLSSQCIIFHLISLFKIQYGDTLRSACMAPRLLWQSFQQFSVHCLESLHVCKYGNVGKCVICHRSTAVLAALRLTWQVTTDTVSTPCFYTTTSPNYGPLCLSFLAVKHSAWQLRNYKHVMYRLTSSDDKLNLALSLHHTKHENTYTHDNNGLHDELCIYLVVEKKRCHTKESKPPVIGSWDEWTSWHSVKNSK